MKRLVLPLFLALSAAAAVAQPAVEITKSCPKLRYLGREAEFQIVVTNKGNSPALNVVVTDTLSGGEFRSADANGSRSGSNVVWQIGTLPAGESRTMTVLVNCTSVGIIKNEARVTYCAEAMAACETEVRGIPAILLECVDSPDPIEIGGQVTYTITVTNQGTEVGTNIKVACTLPPEQEFISAAGATNATNSGKSVTFAALPSLAPKARATFTVTVKGIQPADSRFRIELTSDQLVGAPVMETESTHIYE